MEVFGKNRKAVIDKKEEIAEGVILTYKIYQPQADVFKSQDKLRFKKVEADDIINAIFSRPEAKAKRKGLK